jgi:hypothetical protein
MPLYDHLVVERSTQGAERAAAEKQDPGFGE